MTEIKLDPFLNYCPQVWQNFINQEFPASMQPHVVRDRLIAEKLKTHNAVFDEVHRTVVFAQDMDAVMWTLRYS